MSPLPIPLPKAPQRSPTGSLVHLTTRTTRILNVSLQATWAPSHMGITCVSHMGITGALVLSPIFPNCAVMYMPDNRKG
jgi:hypothetical protein